MTRSQTRKRRGISTTCWTTPTTTCGTNPKPPDDVRFDAFNMNTWSFKPAPTPWYRTRQAVTALIATAGAAAAIVVAGVLLVFRGPGDYVEDPAPVNTTAPSTAPAATASSRPPAPPPPPAAPATTATATATATTATAGAPPPAGRSPRGCPFGRPPNHGRPRSRSSGSLARPPPGRRSAWRPSRVARPIDRCNGLDQLVPALPVIVDTWLATGRTSANNSRRFRPRRDGSSTSSTPGAGARNPTACGIPTLPPRLSRPWVSTRWCSMHSHWSGCVGCAMH